ncbi:Bug family tripartite tricarboxylate transporter substrate binding protein [Candidimonas nitroreducens]|uniref:ABC transporter substrate-binding protein n=1 Tax=Candidimonas nitroreducens TaxID=683354 RepID=A0A225MCD3_9BURK|nr:tripartite tricarboxylate transporter substrate binding protein [Candidimonas nitroreducens]OWT58945.1 hypothetical protein CEY11_12145 [Candidimonas nitroreducens]
MIMSSWKARLQGLLYVVAGMLVAFGAQAAYPTGPVRLIVPFAPGGGTDIVSRILGRELATELGKAIIIDNKPGANGIIGTIAGKQAASDGQTLLLAIEATVAMNPWLYKSARYTAEDFQPISLVSNQPYVVVANLSLKANTLHELVALAKSSPTHLNYATGASAAFLAGELLKSTAGINMINIPYKGSGEALSDVLAGRVEVMVASPVSVLPYIKNGKLKALAVTSGKKYSLLPKVPTVAEQGYPGFDVVGWYGLVAPKGTPSSIIDKLNAAVNKALSGPELRQRFEKVGVEPTGDSPDEFGHYMRSESQRWQGVIRQAGVQKQ